MIITGVRLMEIFRIDLVDVYMDLHQSWPADRISTRIRNCDKMCLLRVHELQTRLEKTYIAGIRERRINTRQSTNPCCQDHRDPDNV